MKLTSTENLKIVLSHPTGNANTRAAMAGLLDANLLSAFYTTIAAFPNSLLDRLSVIKPFSEFGRRSYDSELKHITRTSPLIELARIVALKTNLKRFTAHETGLFSIDAVYKRIDQVLANDLKKLKINGVNCIYAYEDGALHSFRKAKQLQMKCLYDLPIGYWRTARRLMENEVNIWPEWAPTLTGFRDSLNKLANKDEELKLADKIFVASSFTSNSLTDYPGALNEVKIIPYGFPTVQGERDYTGVSNTKPLKLLFVGGLSQRKGIANLFAAADAIGRHVELTVIGNKIGENCPALDLALKRVKWIPSMPHNEVLKTMREHDVLVFPTLFEGFGLVITEAMAQGTPVITTERCAGPDLIKHEENGWLVEAGSTLALQAIIEQLINNKSLVVNAGHQAMTTARNRPWKVYGAQLAASIRNI